LCADSAAQGPIMIQFNSILIYSLHSSDASYKASASKGKQIKKANIVIHQEMYINNKNNSILYYLRAESTIQ
jgi:hypothetical protein